MKSLINLLFNVGQAANVPERKLFRSIFGERETWRTELELDCQSEYAAGFPVTTGSLATLAQILLSPLPRWPWDTSAGSARIEYPEHDGARQAHAGERWFLINGICTDRSVARINAQMLFKLFGRPITCLYNACNGVFLDLLECAVGKQWDTTTDAAKVALPELLDALRDPTVERVVLISHSQGTIVAAVLLKALEELLHRDDRGFRWNRHEPSPEREIARKLTAGFEARGNRSKLRVMPRVQSCITPEQVAKLEMYNFANCATSMESFVQLGGETYPFIESYGNEYDLVARLGVLAPTHGIGSARIDGERYLRPRTWGHLLNVHYLFDLLKDYQGAGRVAPALEPFAGNRRRRPKLLDYMRPELAQVVADQQRAAE